jgi:hypothetical protein
LICIKPLERDGLLGTARLRLPTPLERRGNQNVTPLIEKGGRGEGRGRGWSCDETTHTTPSAAPTCLLVRRGNQHVTPLFKRRGAIACASLTPIGMRRRSDAP